MHEWTELNKSCNLIGLRSGTNFSHPVYDYIMFSNFFLSSTYGFVVLVYALFKTFQVVKCCGFFFHSQELLELGIIPKEDCVLQMVRNSSFFCFFFSLQCHLLKGT